MTLGDQYCGGRLERPSGSFKTPNWPDRDYPAGVSCVWHIVAPKNQVRLPETGKGVRGRFPPRPRLTGRLLRRRPQRHRLCFLFSDGHRAGQLEALGRHVPRAGWGRWDTCRQSVTSAPVHVRGRSPLAHAKPGVLRATRVTQSQAAGRARRRDTASARVPRALQSTRALLGRPACSVGSGRFA